MKIYFLSITFFFLLLCINGSISAQQDFRHSLWYEQEVDEWMKALPLGNGRLGIMAFGGVDTETLALNEITMWSGQPDPFQERPCGKELLDEIRQLFFDGKLAEGNRLASGVLAGTPHSFGSHVPTGDLKIKFHHPQGKISGYKRVLDLNTAVHTVSYKIGNVTYTREYFCSNPDGVLIVRLTAGKARSLTMDISLDMLRESEIIARGNSLEFTGQVSFPRQGPGGVNFAGKVGISTDGGSVSAGEKMLHIQNANSVTIALDIRTDYKDKEYKRICSNTVENALSKSYKTLRDIHVADHSALYKRTELYLGKSEGDNLPTDKRWERVKSGQEDVGLDALFFHYARYLLIASSRHDSPLPANLQGVWNDNLACNMGWTNDYHLDINTQQNYWLANIGNLAECNAPLFSYINDLAKWGQTTARKVYNARGWTANTVANVWGYTASGSGVNWGLFPTASAWIASHLWTHYKYTKDESFLKEKAYPVLKSNAEFYLDYMVEHPKTGYLMTGPGTSPENSFRYQGEELSLSMMPACDRQLVYEAFTACIEAAGSMEIDALFRDTLQQALAKLPPIMVGSNGAIQEWFEDFEEAQPNHRHTTHLLGLYPYSQISPVKTPELAVAARKTIEYRLAAENWEDVEWSRANMICFYARLLDARNAYKSVVQLQREFARENLLTISPAGIAGAPYDIFIFDGNEAGGAGIAEMLIQSHEEYIELLPALPAQWHTGNFKGLCVAGGAELSAEWKDSELKKVMISASVDNTFRLKLPTNKGQLTFPKKGVNNNFSMSKKEGYILVTVDLKKGESLEMKLK